MEDYNKFTQSLIELIKAQIFSLKSLGDKVKKVKNASLSRGKPADLCK